MGRRRPASVNTGPRIPSELYLGIPPGAFRYFGSDRPSPDARKHAEWTRAVLAAGWTVSALREAAPRDQGYLNWRRAARRARLLENDPGGDQYTGGDSPIGESPNTPRTNRKKA